MFYYQLKLYWIKFCWFYERPLNCFFHICTKIKLYIYIYIFNPLQNHYEYVEIETIVPLSFL
jgi:hypothetical protein